MGISLPVINCIHWRDDGTPLSGVCAHPTDPKGDAATHHVLWRFCSGFCKQRQPGDPAAAAVIEAPTGYHRPVNVEAMERIARAVERSRQLRGPQSFSQSLESATRLLWLRGHMADLREMAAEAREQFQTGWEAKIPELGCACRVKYHDLIQRIPRPAFGAPASAWFRWRAEIHNEVNVSKNPPTPIMPIGDAHKFWSGPVKLLIHFFQCPGDSLWLTAAVRDLHLSNPGRFITDVRAAAREHVFAHNPRITQLDEHDPGVFRVDLGHSGDTWPAKARHCTEALQPELTKRLGVVCDVTAKRGELWLTDAEKSVAPISGKYIVVNAGGKSDATVKTMPFELVQRVVAATPEIRWVQVGELAPGHTHPLLSGRNALDLCGRTTWRQTIVLTHHSMGVFCGLTGLSHIAAALDRPSVILAGGRESDCWERYDNSAYFSAIGKLDCCRSRGCWRWRTVALGDMDSKDNELCLNPTRAGEQDLPACHTLYDPAAVLAAVRKIFNGGG